MNNKKEAPKANKNLGQHFLSDQAVVENICGDMPDDTDLILEIGPGPGALTSHLATKNIPYLVIEKDIRFQTSLLQYIKAEQIILYDALEFDLEHYLATHKIKAKNIWLISNLPYNIGALIYIKFLKIPAVKNMTLMFQKEVARKITTPDFKDGRPKKKSNMGPLMALSHNFFECTYLFDVPPIAFSPPPKVDSAVVSVKRINRPKIVLAEFTVYEKFLKTLFTNRRKQLQKNLRSLYDKELLETTMLECKLALNARAEDFSIDQIYQFYQKLKKN